MHNDRTLVAKWLHNNTVTVVPPRGAAIDRQVTTITRHETGTIDASAEQLTAGYYNDEAPKAWLRKTAYVYNH